MKNAMKRLAKQLTSSEILRIEDEVLQQLKQITKLMKQNGKS